jgi:hypothetical protein
MRLEIPREEVLVHLLDIKDLAPSFPSPFLTCCTILLTSLGDDWSHSPFIRWSPSSGFLEFSSAVRQMPGDQYTVPRIIS